MFDKFSPVLLRDAIEFELKKTDNAKDASIRAIANLKKDPTHYVQFGIMTKAKDTSKLVKKVITNKLGKQQTVYVKGVEDKAVKDTWMGKFAKVFGFKDRKQVIQKIQQDYTSNEIDKKYGLTWDGWKNHLSEYFNNKSKWDNFFSGKKEKKEKGEKKTGKSDKKKTDKKVKKDGLKLSVMKELFGLYGGAQEKPVEDNFDTMPDVETQADKNEKLREEGKLPPHLQAIADKQKGFEITDVTPEGYGVEDSESIPDKPEIPAKTDIITDTARVQEIKNSILEGEAILKTGMFNGRKLLPAEIQSVQKSVDNAKKKIGLNILDSMQDLDPNILDETPEQKKEDVKVAKEINKATPETRNKTEREIAGIPEPPPEEDIERPKVAFSPTDSEITIPFYKGGDPEKFKALDYTRATPKDIFLVSKKNILTDPKPEYIPEIDERVLSTSKFFPNTMKLGENKYVIQTQRELIRGTSQPIQGENKYVIVSRDVLAATLDYYLQKEKAVRKKESDDYEKEHGRKIKRKKISMISANRMTYSQLNFMNSFTGKSGEDWDLNTEIRNDIKQKTEDMDIQFEEYYNTHAKGQETSYGDVGTNDALLNEYGVKVKRQNGAEINETEINEIQSAITDVYSVFGDRSSMSKSFGLKISHAGDVNMHARKAVGIFIPSMKAIGVSAKYGQEGTGFILAHEFGHFMDYYVGDKSDKHYVSDDPDSTAGRIADIFRKNMKGKQTSKYQNRTCECFARSMEQYWSIKTENTDFLSQFDADNHPTNEVFKERVMPLIDQFLTENQELLKAMFTRKFNTKNQQFEYRKIK